MHYNSSNPLIPHASTSILKDEFKMQIMINALARRMIKKDAKDHPAKRTYYIHDHALIIIS